VEAVQTHIEEVVIQYKIPTQLEHRFDWLSENDVDVKQDFLNHLRQLEKSSVVEGARVRLPVMLAHLRGEAGRLTQRVADVLKIGNHELELQIEKNASGRGGALCCAPLAGPGKLQVAVVGRRRNCDPIFICPPTGAEIIISNKHIGVG
jgi:hypothetical protein